MLLTHKRDISEEAHMFIDNDNEKREQSDTRHVPVTEPVQDTPLYSEPMQSAPPQDEPTQSASLYSEPMQSTPPQTEPLQSTPPQDEPTQSAPLYSESIQSAPPQIKPLQNAPLQGEPIQSAPVQGATVYSPPPYTSPSYTSPPYSPPYDAPWNMYSPGICVNQPLPRSRYNGTIPVKAPREHSRWLGSFLRAACLVIVCALLSGASAYFVMEYRFNRGDFKTTNQVVIGGGAVDTGQNNDLSAPVTTLTEGMSAQDIYDMARTQVVGIVTEAPNMFGGFDSQETMTPVSGSGFIISSDGYILTNFHVIELAHANDLPLNVILSDGTSYNAEIIGYESNSDVAVIKIDATGLNPAFIGDSSKIRAGQTIYAVGNPFGDLVYTMTDGIVSALDRPVTVDRKNISTFQFSAAVNSGNSGGPIYNTNGEVIGIVTAKVIRGNVEGIGFAIPINDAVDIATELIEYGYISGRPLIGITGQTVTPGHADYYGWVVGAYVRQVSPNSAAEAAGIVIGDIITALAGDDIDSIEALKTALRGYKAGESTTITVWRNGEDIVLNITFDEDLSAGQPQRTALPEPDSPDPFKDIP